MNEPLIAYYGDDLTGSTDALEVLSKAGARTLLFIHPPTPETLARYPDCDAIGVAGRTRSLGPEAMEAELGPAFDALCKLHPAHIHYKVCSTFDSSPTVGSIGRAIDVGRRVIASAYVPVLAAAPDLGRYCAFGHLFAAAGIGFDGQVFRLDRHPTASRHPTTPMRESDLSLHLSEQTTAKIATFDLLKLELSPADQVVELEELISQGAEVVLFDALNQQHLQQIASLIDRDDPSSGPLFSVGSSGIETALGLHWADQGKLRARTQWDPPRPFHQALVISGSCSPVTSSQIEWAKRAGFAEVALNTAELISAESSTDTLNHSTQQVLELIRGGKSVVVHTTLGNEDARLDQTRAALENSTECELEAKDACAPILGTALGWIAHHVLQSTSLRRLCIAGGDTASFAGRALGIEAIEMIRPLTLGAPLCRIHAPETPTDGVEAVFKGGQVGSEDFFGSLLTG